MPNLVRNDEVITADQVRECMKKVYLEGYSDGSVNRGAHIDETDWKAIADELNTICVNRNSEEIVRCRDCKRFKPQGTFRFNDGVVNKDTCDVIRGFVVQINPDGFCAWGERR